jgi:hypothetical protein
LSEPCGPSNILCGGKGPGAGYPAVSACHILAVKKDRRSAISSNPPSDLNQNSSNTAASPRNLLLLPHPFPSPDIRPALFPPLSSRLAFGVSVPSCTRYVSNSSRFCPFIGAGTLRRSSSPRPCLGVHQLPAIRRAGLSRREQSQRLIGGSQDT